MRKITFPLLYSNILSLSRSKKKLIANNWGDKALLTGKKSNLLNNWNVLVATSDYLGIKVKKSSIFVWSCRVYDQIYIQRKIHILKHLLKMNWSLYSQYRKRSRKYTGEFKVKNRY